MLIKYRSLLVAAGLLLSAVITSPVTLNAQTISVPSPAPDTVSVTVGNTVVRDYSDNPLTLGFNVPWAAFQGTPTLNSKLWDSDLGALNPELVSFLKGDFAKALYRYPGGTHSIYFEWEKTVGSNRSPVLFYTDGNSYIVEFGFDEFMQMIESVGGEAMCVMNLISIDGEMITDEQWPTLKQRQIGWLEYANAPVNEDWNSDGVFQGQQRSLNGHPSPYEVLLWELGNELDGKIDYQTYIDRCTDLISEMRGVDPGLDFLVLGCTAPGQGRPMIEPLPPFSIDDNNAHWRDWHNAMYEGLGHEMWTLTMHPYYDGTSVMWVQSILNQVWSDALAWAQGEAAGTTAPGIAVTESARWPAVLEDLTTWPLTTAIKGAVSTCDFSIMQQYLPQTQMALNHAICVQSPWALFSEVDVLTGKYLWSTTFAPRPLAHALKLLNRVSMGADILETDIQTSNLSDYGYDVRSFGYQYADSGIGGAFMVNRANVDRTISLGLPEWADGPNILRIDMIGGPDDTRVRSHYIATDVVSGRGKFRLSYMCVLNALSLGPDVILNGDFEEGNAGQVPAKWELRLVPESTGTAQLVADATGSLNGENVVRLQVTSTSGGVNLVQPRWKNALLDAGGVFSTYPDDSFVFRANARTSGTTADKVRLKLQVFDANYTYLSSSPVSATAPADTAGSWEPLELEFVPTELLAGKTFGHSELVLMNHSASGYADFDSVTLQHRENKATNPYFADVSPADNSPDSWVSRCNGTGTVSYYGSVNPCYVRLSKSQTGDGNQFLQVHGSTSELANRRNTHWRLRAWVRYQDLDASGAVLKVQLFSSESGYLSTSPIGEKMTGSSPTGGSGWVQVELDFYPAELFGAESFSRAEIMLQNNSATGNVDVRYMSLEALD